MGILTLQNSALRLDFDADTGALTGLTALKTGWRILDRPHLGLSFQMMLPLHDRRNNRVLGEKQKLNKAEVDYDRNTVEFTWDELTSEHGGIHPIRVILLVNLTDRQAVYTMHVENRFEYVVENVYCPCIGDVSIPSDETKFDFLVHFYGSFTELSIWPKYQNTMAYFGVNNPGQMSVTHHTAGAPMTPFVLLQGEKRGLFIGSLSRDYNFVAWMTELLPGYATASDSRFPAPEEIGGREVSLRFEAIHMPFLQPGETCTLAPVAIEPYQGDWHKGADIYKNWRDGWMKTAAIPAWARDPHAWQQIQINSSEDELWFPYGELVNVGRECAENGVKAIQLTGWNLGGQDRCNPSHDPDPRLGGGDRLRQAIHEVQEMGVKVVLFTKFIWADRSTERYRSGLHRYAIKDMYGDAEVFSGYSYQSVSQRLGTSVRRLIPMCFLSGEYLAICVEEFKKAVELGADGILFDECSWHAPALFCFGKDHGHKVGAMAYKNDNLLIDLFKESLSDRKDGFLFAGEACYDWMFQNYHMSYIRSESMGHYPLTRYLQPEMLIMTAVVGFNDRNMINQCLMYRYVISYEPYNFKGRLSDYPLTVAYGSMMDGLRSELREYLWDGLFVDTCGVEARSADGSPHKPYAAFASKRTGNLCVVVCNYDSKQSKTVFLKTSGPSGIGQYRLVDDPQWKPTAAGIVIPPYSAAVAIE